MFVVPFFAPIYFGCTQQSSNFLTTRLPPQGNPYIYGSFSASGAAALLIGPYQLQSTPDPSWYMSNVMLGVVGQLDTETLQVHRHAE